MADDVSALVTCDRCGAAIVKVGIDGDGDLWWEHVGKYRLEDEIVNGLATQVKVYRSGPAFEDVGSELWILVCGACDRHDIRLSWGRIEQHLTSESPGRLTT